MSETEKIAMEGKVNVDKLAWRVLDKYFADNPNNLVSHHLESFNHFFNMGVQRTFKENNPIKFIAKMDVDDNTADKKKPDSTCDLYIGGKDGSLIYFGKPVIFDSNNFTHYMYPNDARLRNMTYGMTIHYDVEVEMTYYKLDENNKNDKNKKIYLPVKESFTLDKILLGTFPIMLQSNFCILDGMNRDVRFYMGECRNDYGGYFIIDGKEKVIVCQEKFANNQLSVKTNKIGSIISEKYICSASVKSVSEDVSKPKRTTRVMIMTPTKQYKNTQIVVDVPNVKRPVPLFILMRALGVITDKEIIETCLLDIKKEESYVDFFIASIHDATEVFTQSLALEYIATFTKAQTIENVLMILADMFLPHIGDVNFLDKAYYLGYMVFRMLKVYTKQDTDTNIDEYNFKRIETSGSMLDDLFSEYYAAQKKQIALKIQSEHYYHQNPPIYEGEFFKDLIQNNVNEIFKERIVEDGFKSAFKGKWGAELHTKRVGIVQDLSRLSWNSYTTHMRKITLQLDKTSKVYGPRLLTNSQWGFIDPFDIPDSALDKHFTILARLSTGIPPGVVIEWLKSQKMEPILKCNNPKYIYNLTKIFVNGNWVGVVDEAIELVNKFKLYRRLGRIPFDVGISFNYKNEININTDAGRLVRPVYYCIDMDNGQKTLSILNKLTLDTMSSSSDDKTIRWQQFVTGFLEENEPKIDFNDKEEIKTLKSKQCLIEYVDTQEEQSALIATTYTDILVENNYYTHLEIDGSLILSVMGNLVAYPDHNQLARNSFSCGQSKQAVSLYNTNYQLRMDKMGVVLNYGQIPLIKTRYLNYINKEEMPYGVNTIVAIMSYTGYNVEDAILINEASIQRGLFRTTYLTTYEGREESSTIKKKNVEVAISSTFNNVLKSKMKVSNINSDYDYSKLDDNGFIKDNEEVNDKTVLIGKLTTDPEDSIKLIDTSVHTKKGQTGHVDKVYVSVGEDGFKISKVRIREDRIPAFGDKMASRCGQKGTIGMIIPEKDMPFTTDGIRPDLIINPHALPSRMTIGQLVESMFGKVCAMYGGFGEGTAFQIKGANYSTYGPMLQQMGYHSSGNQLLHDGITGEQLEADIFIGPTYYMRLKHMVKDKINHRDEGPNTSLTRQPVQGRSNDGGLRIGEMERDGVLAHGMSKFLNESFMVRAGDDHFELAVCNKTGAVAIYNRQRNLFLSPLSDGPIKFSKKNDEDFKIESVSRFGRSFSVVLVPYTFKLLMQELEIMNVQMRIITDDNVDQLMGLCYSDNIKHLLKIRDNKATVEDTITNYVKNIKNINIKKPEEVVKSKSWIEEEFNKNTEKTFKTVDEAIDWVKKCFIYIQNGPIMPVEGGIVPLPLQTYDSKWLENLITAINTIKYIFNEVKCNCYLLCVVKGKNKLVKLEPSGIPQFFQDKIAEALQTNKDTPTLNYFKTKLGNKEGVFDYNQMRLMNCILSSRGIDKFSTEYKEFLSGLKDIPNGVYVLNLTDQVLIRKDNLLPWGKERSEVNNNFLPVLSLSGAEGFDDIPIPNYDDINLFYREDGIEKLKNLKNHVLWNKKLQKAVFRGSTTGCGFTENTNARINLVKSADDDLFDVGFTKTKKEEKNNANEPPGTMTGPIRFDVLTQEVGIVRLPKERKDRLEYNEQSAYKYIIHVDGNVAAYRLAETMTLGSVILKVEGPYILWYEHLLVKWEITMNESEFNDHKYNCISVNPDLSNLKETIEWCIEHDQMCEIIAQNGGQLAKEILNKDFIDTSFTNILKVAAQTASNNYSSGWGEETSEDNWLNKTPLWVKAAEIPVTPPYPPPVFEVKTPPYPPPGFKPSSNILDVTEITDTSTTEGEGEREGEGVSKSDIKTIKI